MSKSILPKWIKRWEAWLAFFVLVGSVYAGLASAIPNFPRWAWFSELTALAGTHEADTVLLAGQIKDNTIRALEEKVGYLKRERRALRAEDRSLKVKGQPDLKLQEEMDENEDDLQDALSELKAKRGH